MRADSYPDSAGVAHAADQEDSRTRRILCDRSFEEPFEDRMKTAFTDESLRARILECERRWGIKIGQPFPFSSAFVAVGTTTAGNEVVVKIATPHRETATEISALRLYGGRGAVGLLDADVQRGYLLLERVHPGERLTCIADDQHATRIAAGVMRNLYAPRIAGLERAACPYPR